jgi:hypothetical protein
MKQELEELRAKLDWLDNSFLLDNEIDKKKAYGFIKENPSGVRFVYKKYPNLRPVLKEICDPENPLYLQSVADQLKDLVEFFDLKSEVDLIKSQHSEVMGRLNEARTELAEKNTEIDSLESQIPVVTKNLEDLQRIMANLSTEEAKKRIKEFYESVDRFITGVFESQKKQPITESFNSVRLDMNQINLLRMLQKTAKSDTDFIENSDLISEEMLDAKRKEIKAQMEKEMQEGETAMLAFTEHNPLKTLNKSVSKIEEAQEQLANSGEFSRESGWFYNIHTIPNIQAILDIPKELLNNLVQQVNNVNARKGGEMK